MGGPTLFAKQLHVFVYLYNTNNTYENELHLLDVTLHYMRTFHITLVLSNFTQNK